MTLYGDGAWELAFDNDDMFLGHTIVATVRDGAVAETRLSG